MRLVQLIRSYVAPRLRRHGVSSTASSSSSSVNGIGTKLQDGRQSTPAAAAAAAAAAANGRDDKFNFPRPEFDNTSLIYASKSTAELIRAYLVFGACTLDVLVNNQTKVFVLYAIFLCVCR